MAEWDPSLYLKYGRERTQPAIDLCGRIPCENPGRILDVGCGPGNSTQVLAARFPKAQILGVDASAEMVEAARKAMPEYSFMQYDAGGDLSGLGGGYDVVFSNACLQWIPGHATLLPRLMKLLGPGGVLCVQVPLTHWQPVYKALEEMLSEGEWAGRFDGARNFYALEPREYYDILSPVCAGLDIWQTRYYHVMTSPQAIIDWYSGTGLRPYLQALDAARAQRFKAQLLGRITNLYPAQQDGKVLFEFPRLFFMAVAKG